MLPEPRGRTKMTRRLVNIRQQLGLLEPLERLERSAGKFQAFQKFKTFQSLNKNDGKHDYRRTIHLANGQVRFFLMIDRFLASNSVR